MLLFHETVGLSALVDAFLMQSTCWIASIQLIKSLSKGGPFFPALDFPSVNFTRQSEVSFHVQVRDPVRICGANGGARFGRSQDSI